MSAMTVKNSPDVFPAAFEYSPTLQRARLWAVAAADAADAQAAETQYSDPATMAQVATALATVAAAEAIQATAGYRHEPGQLDKPETEVEGVDPFEAPRRSRMLEDISEKYDHSTAPETALHEGDAR